MARRVTGKRRGGANLFATGTNNPAVCRVQSKPQLLAWLTCDGVHIDPGSGKHTVLGVFSNIHGERFPLVHPLMFWFLTITDCAPGDHRLKISMGFNNATPQKLIERPFQSRSPLDRL